MLKKIFITLVVLIVLLAIGLCIFLLTFDLNHYRRYTEQKLSEVLNHPVQIGSMNTKLSLVPTVQVNNFKVLQKEGNPEAILNVPTMEVTLEIIPLIKNFQIEIQRINILHITTDLSSLSQNISPKTEQPKAPLKINSTNDSLFTSFWVKEFKIKTLLCRFTNREKKEQIELTDFTLKDLSSFTFKFTHNKQSFDVRGSFGLLTKILQQNALPIDLNIRQGKNTINLLGRISNLKDLNKIRLSMNLDSPKLTTFLKPLGIELPSFLDIPVVAKLSVDGNLQKMNLGELNISIDNNALSITGAGKISKITKDPKATVDLSIALKESNFANQFRLQPFEIKTNLTLDKSNIDFSDINFLAGRSDMQGTFGIDLKSKPILLKPNLTSSYFSFNDILQKKQPDDKNSAAVPVAKKNSSVFSKEKIQWSYLNLFNMRGRFAIQHLFLSDHISDFASLVLDMQIRNGIADAKVKSQALSGEIDGTAQFNSAQKSIKTDFNIQNLNLDKIKYVYQKIRGIQSNAEIKLSSKGDTIKDIMSNLNGSFIIESGNGSILSQWFNSLPFNLMSNKQRSGFLSFSTSDQKSDLLCAVINVPIKNGIVTSDQKVAIQTSALNFLIDGQIDLKKETLDLAVIPSVNQNTKINQLTSITQMLHIVGPWQDISWKIDPQKTIENKLKSLLNKDNKSDQTEDSLFLCHSALGKPLRLEKNKTNKEKTKSTTVQKQKQKSKGSLKEQLLESLSQTIAAETAKK